ncbi:MAG: nucleotidyl transferase AbiEii/AbiGii toxin family protein [Draconibacterium sp.]
MLHAETVEKGTFDLLKTLMSDKQLAHFNLAGGTALALYLGHRISVDLDLFTPNAFEARDLSTYLNDNYNFNEDFIRNNTLRGDIANVKIDCITYNYPMLEKPVVDTNGVRLYGIKDIAAMKLSSIVDNGTRLKDFIDIASLSVELSLSDMLGAYNKKFKGTNAISPIKGLSYYDDINFKEPIQMTGANFNWNKIEKRIKSMIKNDKLVFADLPCGSFKNDRQTGLKF